MSRARDDRRRNMRREFALYRDDADQSELGSPWSGPSPVGSFWLTEADGCSEQFVSGPYYGVSTGAEFSDTHSPGSHVLGVFT